MKVNADLHIHSKYSAAVSKGMDLPEISKEAARKGANIVGTGDCLHSGWMREINALEERDGLYHLDGTYFALTVEVEDAHRVHHMILLPEISKALELREAFASKSSTLDMDGRPKVHLDGAEIADAVLGVGGMIGPSHAFTPWTGIYAYYGSLDKCYQEHAKDIPFIELGLSADTDYADRIADLSTRTFLSDSDAHSPRSNKLAREFNQLQITSLSYKDLEKAIHREGGCHPVLNVGFYPEEGKYNHTACTRCYRQYSAKEMEAYKHRCPVCQGIIKLGVRDRVDSLADYPAPIHPDHRPPYLHLIPLAEIIAMALGNKSPYTAGVQKRWEELIQGRTEIDVLVDVDLSELRAEPKVIAAIDAFRHGRVDVKPGGGGKYGEISLPGPAKEKQRSILDF